MSRTTGMAFGISASMFILGLGMIILPPDVSTLLIVAVSIFTLIFSLGDYVEYFFGFKTFAGILSAIAVIAAILVLVIVPLHEQTESYKDMVNRASNAFTLWAFSISIVIIASKDLLDKNKLKQKEESKEEPLKEESKEEPLKENV